MAIGDSLRSQSLPPGLEGRTARMMSAGMLALAREEDAERIASLHIASWRATYSGELSQTFLRDQDLAARTAEWSYQLRDGAIVFLAVEAEAAVGFISCGPARGNIEGGDWEIYNLHVASTLQGQGRGRLLFGAAAGLGRERGAKDLILWVVGTNRRARVFYERNGMQWDGGEQEHPLAPGECFAEVRYRMPLFDWPSKAPGEGPKP
jgi:ribosomal protein S18 acetylase RimI-like enzyme